MKRVMIACGVATLLAVIGCTESHDAESGVFTSISTVKSVIFSCDDGTDFIADFSGRDVTLAIADGDTVTLQSYRTRSGTVYRNASYEFRSAGHSATLRMSGKRPANCAGME